MKKLLCVPAIALILFAVSCKQSSLPNIGVLPGNDAINQMNESNSIYITISSANSEYTAILYDNETAETFLNRLPLEIEMSELNGNEKYAYTEALPAQSERIKTVNAGDIMLYGEDCLVIFYESFATSYSYTKIGRIEGADTLKEALGPTNVRVKFALRK